MKTILNKHINKATGDNAAGGIGSFLSGLGESAVPFFGTINKGIDAIAGIVGDVIGGVTEQTKAHTEAFNKGLDSNNEVIIRNHVSQEKNVGIYIIIGMLVLILIINKTYKK